jgi:predicted DNA-binding ribbon-helix-helix protein
MSHRTTSITLENSFWAALQEIARRRNVTAASLIERIDAERTGNLSSAIREFVLAEFRKGYRPADEGEAPGRDDDGDRLEYA